MQVSFVETMRGALTGDDGRAHALEFEIKAEAPLAAFVRDGMTRVCGVVRASPWADEAVTEGTLHIDVAHRRLAYRLSFGAFTLAGEKHVRLRSLVHSLTTLPVTLADATGRALAHGEVKFDLRDLPSFASSWLPLSRHAQRALDAKRRLVTRRAMAS